MMHYTYAHYKNNEIFYYGKGLEKRAYSKNSRNAKWHEKAKDGYKVEFLAGWKTEKEALDHEKFLIWCARDMGKNIVNICSGGAGASGSRHWLGRKHNIKTKEKIRLGNLGLKRRKSQKFTDANAGVNNPNWQGIWITPEGMFNTCREVAKHYGIDPRTVRARCKGYKEQLVNTIKTYPPKDGWSFEPLRRKQHVTI